MFGQQEKNLNFKWNGQEVNKYNKLIKDILAINLSNVSFMAKTESRFNIALKIRHCLFFAKVKLHSFIQMQTLDFLTHSSFKFQLSWGWNWDKW